MDFPSFNVRVIGKSFRRLWHSERGEAVRFYAGFFRWPLLLVLFGLVGEKLIYYGILPIQAVVRREIAYHEAAQEDARGQDQAAMLSIRRALLETRDDARLWRLAAKIADHARSAEAAYCWQRVDQLAPGSTDTQLSLAEAALTDQQPDLAAAALAEVAARDQETNRYLIDGGNLAQSAGQPERARACFERVEASNPRDDLALFALAAWHAGQAAPRDLERAHDLLTRLALRPSDRPAALRALIELEVKRGSFAEAQQQSETLLASPGAVFFDRIERLEIAERAGDGSTDERLRALLTRSNSAEIGSVLAWMTAHGRAEPALLWIRRQSEEMQDDPAIGTARAGCLAVLGDWEHLRDDQATDTWVGHEPERLMILAQADLALKDEDDARAAWNEAVGACRDADDFLVLLRGADKMAAPDGWVDEKAEVWDALARQYPDQQGPLRALLAYQLGRDDLLQVQAIEARLAELDPADLALAANRDLISLLREANVEKASADLQRLVAVAPGNATVATAAAYSLYLSGKYNEALGVMGALSEEELHAPERAAYLGQLLAVAGPVEAAESALQTALARPRLLAEERTGVQRALELVAYRRAMSDLLHAPMGPACDRGSAFFTWQAPSGNADFLMGQSVAQSLRGDTAPAMETLGRVEPGKLDPARLSIYQGAVLELGGHRDEAARYLELVGDLPADTAGAKLHHSLESWWDLRRSEPSFDARPEGLFATYRALEAVETGPAFWRDDLGRELELTRTSLRHGASAPAVEDRLESLLRYLPATPTLEAQIGYALFLQGRVQPARARLEILTADELTQPEAAFYYGTILRGCGETKRAEDYLRHAGSFGTEGEQVALQRSEP